MPSVCTVSTTGQAAAWPDGLRAMSTASSRTKSTFSSRSRPPSTGPGSPTRPSQSASSSAERHDAHALAVVAAARGLGDDGPADAVAEGGDLGRRRGPGPPRAGDPQPLEALAHGELVLGEVQRGAARVHGDAVVLEGLQDVGRHVLVVEGDDVARGGEGPHGLEVGVVPDRGAGHDERRGGALALGEDRELDAELDRRALHHPGELAAADDADDGESTGGTLGLARRARSRRPSLVARRATLRPPGRGDPAGAGAVTCEVGRRRLVDAARRAPPRRGSGRRGRGGGCARQRRSTAC